MNEEKFLSICWFLKAFGIDEDEDIIHENIYTEETESGTLIHSKESQMVFNSGHFQTK